MQRPTVSEPFQDRNQAVQAREIRNARGYTWRGRVCRHRKPAGAYGTIGGTVLLSLALLYLI
jgi:hypothetical protein